MLVNLRLRLFWFFYDFNRISAHLIFSIGINVGVEDCEAVHIPDI